MSEVNHPGIYIWTDSKGNHRPNLGSIEGDRREKEWLRYRAEALNTKEGIKWLGAHGFTKTLHEDLDWLTENGKI
jgi:hypothetical protein